MAGFNRTASLCFSLSLVAAGCAGGSPAESPCAIGDEGRATAPATGWPTTSAISRVEARIGEQALYYRDVQPIVQRRCQGCHSAGGSAPFPFATYEDARARAQLIAEVTQTRRMPPWMPSGACGDFVDARALGDDEIATIRSWAEGGMPAGDPADAPLVDRRGFSDLGPPDLTLDPGADYETRAGTTDDYHCFFVDRTLPAAKDLVAVALYPGAADVVHHVRLFAVPGSARNVLRAVPTGGAAVGWKCSSQDLGVSVPHAEIGVWGPGTNQTILPPTTGLRLTAGTTFVMEIHYNTLFRGRPAVDRTKIDLFFAAGHAERPAELQVVANVDFKVPACSRNELVSGSMDLTGTLWGVLPHMHLRGRAIRVDLFRANGAKECLIDIPSFRYHEQQFFQFRRPLVTGRGDRISVTCLFDNSRENQPIVDGERLVPSDLGYGERTSDEMCLSYLYVTK